MGIKGLDLEELRQIFEDNRTWIEIGKIIQVAPAPDRSLVRVKISILPDQYEVVARMSWESVGPDAGLYSMPSVGDMVLVGYAEGEPDQAFVIKRLSSKEDTFPMRALLGECIFQALSGQTLNLCSDSKIQLDKGGLVPGSEPLVLGNVLKSALGEFYDKVIEEIDAIISGPVGIDSIGGSVITHPTLVTALTTVKAALTLAKTQYVSVSSTNIVSQLGFTER